MTAEILDYRIQQIANISGICIYDDKSLDEALFKFIQKYNNQKKNIMYLQSELSKNGIKTHLN